MTRRSDEDRIHDFIMAGRIHDLRPKILRFGEHKIRILFPSRILIQGIRDHQRSYGMNMNATFLLTVRIFRTIMRINATLVQFSSLDGVST